jgi:uncharacterized membrane protein YphA (DoxX/SURF4 family)
MRLVVGPGLVLRASSILLSDSAVLHVRIAAILLIGAGILLVAGLWTPIAGVAVAFTELWNMLVLHGDKSGWLLLATVGAALAMLGPSLWSVYGQSMLVSMGGNASKLLLPEKSSKQ